MASARDLRNRIRGIKNISQITRALEAVSASRVRRAQARVLTSRAFAEKAWEILLNVQNATGGGGTASHPLLAEGRSSSGKVMIILISSDRGLAGAYNSNILRVANRFASRQSKQVEYVTIGKKGRDSVVRARENLVAEFSNLPAEPTLADISPIARLAIDEFLAGNVDEVFIAYTDYINLLTQHPVVQRLLPLVPYQTEDTAIADLIKGAPQVTGGATDYEFEPDPASILEEIVPRFTVLQLFQAMLESRASEESSRMVAMRNASDNAASLIVDYTLAYNKARQAAITSEILDIVGGAEALQSTIEDVANTVEQELVAL